MLNTTPPPDAEIELLLASQAHRFPTRAKFPVAGDHGEETILRIVLGAPSGACKPPEGEKATAIWNVLVDAALASNLDMGRIAERLVADCLLWPSPSVYASWRQRWPAIGGDIAYGIMRKIGLGLGSIYEPVDVAPPPKINALLDDNPRACWRRLEAHGATYDVAITPPSPARHDAFARALREPGAKVGELVRQLAEAQTALALEGETVITPGEIFDRYCGLAVAVAIRARRMCESLREVELGNW